MIEEKIAERPERSEEKNPVEEVLLVLNKLVLVAFIVVKLVIVPVVPLSVVSVEEAEVSSEVEAVVAERLVIVVVASDTVPVAVRFPVVRVRKLGDEYTESTFPAHERLVPDDIRDDGVV